MATYNLADMSKWTDKAKRNGQMVMQKSVEYLVQDVRGDVGPNVGQVPVVSGNLRNSLALSTVAMPPVREGSFSDMSGTLSVAIAGLETGETIWIGFQAAYARRINNGFTGADRLGRNYNQSGKFFVQNKADKWQSYVDQAAAEIGAETT